jgi:hypothetical protein
MAVNVCGFSVMTTTAFWTVLRVTSAGLLINSLESSWRVQLMPNSDRSGVLFKTSVKYEKSSMALHHGPLAEILHRYSRTREVVDLRMGTVRQGEEGQQMPVVGNGGIISFLYSNPSLYFWSTRIGCELMFYFSRWLLGKLYRWW